jgi:hypothetical protein
MEFAMYVCTEHIALPFQAGYDSSLEYADPDIESVTFATCFMDQSSTRSNTMPAPLEYARRTFAALAPFLTGVCEVML